MHSNLTKILVAAAVVVVLAAGGTVFAVHSHNVSNHNAMMRDAAMKKKNEAAAMKAKEDAAMKQTQPDAAMKQDDTTMMSH